MASAQILYCLQNTLMSSEHFSRLLEEDQTLSEVTSILYNSLNTSKDVNGKEDMQKKFIAKILESTEETWVKSQVFILSKALHQYLFEDAATLPTIDIIPLQKSIRTVAVSEIMQRDEAKQKTAKVKSILSVLNNKYFAKLVNLGLNNQLTSMLLELSPVKATGFDRAAVQDIVKVYLSLSNKDISLDQASYSITEQLTSDMLKISQIKDYFDCNLFMEKAFGEHNPLKILKTFIASVDRTLTWTIKVLFWCLLLLLCILKGFKAVRLIKVTALCLLSSSILSLIVAAMMINRALMEGLMFHLYGNSGVLSGMMIKYTGLLIKDSGYYLALQAALTVSLCTAALLLLSRIKEKIKVKKSSHRFPVLRAALVILAFILIFSGWSAISITNQYNTFQGDVSKLHDKSLAKSITQGLVEAGGMEFLNLLEHK